MNALLKTIPLQVGSAAQDTSFLTFPQPRSKNENGRKQIGFLDRISFPLGLHSLNCLTARSDNQVQEKGQKTMTQGEKWDCAFQQQIAATAKLI